MNLADKFSLVLLLGMMLCKAFKPCLLILFNAATITKSCHLSLSTLNGLCSWKTEKSIDFDGKANLSTKKQLVKKSNVSAYGNSYGEICC
jgi:hypothetical protein